MTVSLPPKIVEEVEEALEDRHGASQRIQKAQPLRGGCINQSVVLTTHGGDRFFLKFESSAPRDLFHREAAGLDVLRASIDLRIPTVEALGPTWLLLEYVERGRPGPEFGRDLGRGLATLHTSGAQCEEDALFGWAFDNYIGPLAQRNDLKTSWTEFWWTMRLEIQLRSAVDKSLLTPGDLDRWEALSKSIHDLLPATPTACLLHGDLWSGNVYPDLNGSPVLIDPAVYRGDGEVDLAMTELFGGFPTQFYEAYEDVRTISPEYRAYTRDLYQLYPLLVHLNLFGQTYARPLRDALDNVLRHS